MQGLPWWLVQYSFTNVNRPLAAGTNDGPLIPVYDAGLEGTEEDANVINKALHHLAGWIDVSKHSEYDYSNWQGLPLWSYWLETAENGTKANTTTLQPLLGSYTLSNTSYFNLDCTNITGPLPATKFPNSTVSNDSIAIEFLNASNALPRDVYGHQLQQFQYYWRGLVYPSLDTITVDTPMVDVVAQATCNVSMKFVDVQVQCTNSGCYPYRIRWANNTNEFNSTSYGTPFGDAVFRQNFFSNLTQSTGMTDNYSYPVLVQSSDAMGPTLYSLDELPLSSWSSNLLLVLNTYYTLSQFVVSSQIGPNFDYLETHKFDDFFTFVDMKGAILEEKYRIFWQWIPLDFISCLVLLAAAIAACWLRVNTVAPDVFGYVSSMTRGNPDFEQLGSAMDGYERTRELGRRLGHKRVRIGNVQDGEKGLIGFGLAEAKHWHRLHPQKVYV